MDSSRLSLIDSVESINPLYSFLRIAGLEALAQVVCPVHPLNSLVRRYLSRWKGITLGHSLSKPHWLSNP